MARGTFERVPSSPKVDVGCLQKNLRRCIELGGRIPEIDPSLHEPTSPRVSEGAIFSKEGNGLFLTFI